MRGDTEQIYTGVWSSWELSGLERRMWEPAAYRMGEITNLEERSEAGPCGTVFVHFSVYILHFTGRDYMREREQDRDKGRERQR